MDAVLFDLDQTLIDSSIAERARSARNWSQVYCLIPSFILYSGMNEVFEYLRTHYIKVGIVSTSPRSYIERVVNYFNIPNDCIIGFHDAKPIKPHSAPMLKAIEELQVLPGDAISFGDRQMDIIASNSAQIESVACLWGTKEMNLLINSNPSHIIKTPAEIIPLLI